MKLSNSSSFCLTVAVALLALSQSAEATEVWSGNDFVFTKANFADWTLEANQDRITSDTWITRQNTRGWFNIKTEASFSLITGSPSPANTEWAYDLVGNGNDGLPIAASNFANLTFELWRDSVNAFPPSAVGQPGVLHLISEDIYIDITVTSWVPNAGGGFSYTRAQAPIPEPSTGLLLALGLFSLGVQRHRTTQAVIR